LDGPLLSAHEGDWRDRTAIKAVVPTANHRGLFGIAVEPIPAGKLGLACLAGVCLAKVSFQEASHQFCDVTPGQISHLTSTLAGAAQILWRDAGNPAWCLIRFSPMPTSRTQWAIVQSGFVNEDATAPKSVPVRRCDWQGQNVQGEPFYVHTPICLGKATALFEGSVVGYQADADGHLMIMTNCFDDPFGTIKAWNKTAPVPQGWTELSLAAGRFLVGAEAGKPWYEPGTFGGRPLEDLGQHNHPDHNAIGAIYYQSGTNQLDRFVSPLQHVGDDLTPPWYAVRWISRTH